MHLRLLRSKRSKMPSRAVLLAAHGPMVYGLCRRLALPDAEDCYQEIWEKVFRALPAFDPDGSATVRTWIGTIARRHLIDHHRKKVTRGEVVEAPELPSGQPCADELLARKEQHVQLEAALQRLPPHHRRVVLGHHLQGVPIAQLAAEEGCAVGTIKSRLHRAREHLAQLIEELS